MARRYVPFKRNYSLAVDAATHALLSREADRAGISIRDYVRRMTAEHHGLPVPAIELAHLPERLPDTSGPSEKSPPGDT